MAGTSRIAVVGSGPSGFYAVEALLRSIPDCRIDMIERLPTPHGLVRYGVAPDHQKLKQVAAVFDMIARGPRFTLYAGIRVGEVVSLRELMDRHHAVVLATGSAAGRTLRVPGESLPQVYSSAQFVGWYNGHPDHVSLQPDLCGARAAVIGNGNVSLDVCRLLVRSFDDLRASDIPKPRTGRATCGRAQRPTTRREWPNGCIRTPATQRAGKTSSLTSGFMPCRPRALESVASTALSWRASPTAALPNVLPCNLAVTCIGYDGSLPPGVPTDT